MGRGLFFFHVRTCTPLFCISGTTSAIMSKFRISMYGSTTITQVSRSDVMVVVTLLVVILHCSGRVLVELVDG